MRAGRCFFGMGLVGFILVLTNIQAQKTTTKIDETATIPHSRKSFVDMLSRTALDHGAKAAVKQYRYLKANESETYDFGETELNSVVTRLLQNGKIKDAVQICKLNVEMFPLSSHTYDRLGQAYFAAGNDRLAIRNYRRSLELDPNNSNAAAAIKRIEAPEVKVDAASFEKYKGRYQPLPNMLLTILSDKGVFYIDATDRPRFILHPTGDGQFFVREVNAEITFVTDASGAISALLLNQNGRKIEARRLP